MLSLSAAPRICRSLLSFLLVAASACGSSSLSGPEAIAEQDCTGVETINTLCELGLEQDHASCVANNARKVAVCRAATHAYVQCMQKLTCQAIKSLDSVPCEAQNDELDRACPKAPATATATATATGTSAAVIPANTGPATMQMIVRGR